MCISIFRQMCQASEFRHGEENRQRDLNDPNLIVKPGTHFYNGRAWYYVTDKKKMQGLKKHYKTQN